MELKSLLLGLAFSVGIFALKSGAGLGYLCQKETGIRRRIAAFFGFVLGYGLLFGLTWLLIVNFDFLAHLDTIMGLFKNGMTLHIALAILLMVWGGSLLKKENATHTSHGWLLLSVPCPVCFSVILFSGSFLHGLRPGEPYLFVLLALGFIGLALLTAFGLVLMRKQGNEQDLGLMMLLGGLYFMLTLVVVPQFGNVARIYRLSLTSGESFPHDVGFLLVGTGMLFMLGVVYSFWRGSWKLSRL